MNDFVPPGYLSFNDALDRVAEITTLARKPASPAAHDDADPGPLRPGIAGVISAKEAAMIEQRRLAKEVLQKLLYTEQIPSIVITEDGSCHPTPGSIWGGKQWNEALGYDRISFPDSRFLSAYVSGRPIIPKDALEEAFNADGTVKTASVSVTLPAEGETPQPPRRGRKPTWDWNGAIGHLLFVANTPDGLPESQSDIERLVADWFRRTVDAEPSESRVREQVSVWCKQILKKAGN